MSPTLKAVCFCAAVACFLVSAFPTIVAVKSVRLVSLGLALFVLVYAVDAIKAA